MSGEEKEAIAILKKWYNYDIEEIKKDFETVDNATKTILNLIDKQQEEIKKLEKKLANRIELLDYIISKDYISKDKIKNKIEQYKINKKQIFKLEHQLGIASITYDIIRNDYCERMLEDLLKEK